MLTKGIVVLSVIVAFLAGFILWPRVAGFMDKSGAPQQTLVYGDLTLKTSLASPLAQQVASFLQTATKKSLIPSELVLRVSEKAEGPRGDVFMGNWNHDGKFMSVLVGLTSNNEAINYIRVWHMPLASEVNKEKAQVLLSDILDEGFLKDRSVSSCTQIVTQEQKTITECGAMKSDTNGNLLGVTVRTPITLPLPPDITPQPGLTQPDVTVVSACFVPKDGTPAYTTALCI